MKYLFLLFLSFLIISNTRAQLNEPVIESSTGSLISSGNHNPFWSVSNKYGMFDVNDNCVYLRANIYSKSDTTRHIDYFYGFDGVGMLNSNVGFIPQQAYAGLKLWMFRLTGGIRSEHMGTQDSLLSLGGFLYSGNARGLPKISFATNDYFTVPYTFGLLELKGGMSHGWFGNSNQYVKGAYLHDKYGFARLKVYKTLKIFAGLQHASMWGGTSPDTTYEKLPNGLRDFWHVFLVQSGDSTSSPSDEVINKLGNHLASYNAGFNFENHAFKLDFYWQTMLEDKNGRVFVDWQNKPDGLWGLSFTNKKAEAIVHKVLFEYFHSIHQSGDPLKSGGDNYYNNYIYQSGWTNNRMVIGAPVITSPAYNNNGQIQVINNKVRVFHAGIAVNKAPFYIVSKLTFTQNHGVTWTQFDKNQFYGSLDITYNFKKLKNSSITGSLCADNGKWLGNNYGALLTFSKTFNY